MNSYMLKGEINEVYPTMVYECMNSGSLTGKVGLELDRTRELHPYQMIITNPRRRLVTSYGRPVNVVFALAEVLWILQGRDDVEMLSHYNGQISSYSDDGKTFNASYGARMRSTFGNDQLDDALRTLHANPESRQATIVLSHPASDRGWMWCDEPHEGYEDGSVVKHVTKDRACNVLAHLMIRDGALDWYQVVRSNDALWGVPYNWMQWTHVQEFAASRLGVPVGKFIHNADSLHIYERQWEEAAKIGTFDLYKYFEYQHEEMRSDDHTMEQVNRFEESLRAGRIIDIPDVGSYWQSVCLLFLAWHHYKNGRDLLAWQDLTDPRMDPVYGAATMRFFYHHRWYKEECRAIPELINDSSDGELYDWIVASHS